MRAQPDMQARWDCLGKGACFRVVWQGRSMTSGSCLPQLDRSQRIRSAGACGERKEAAEFCRDTRSPDGLQSRCKACYQIYFSLWSAQKKAMRDPVAAAKAAPAGQKICATCGVEKPLGVRATTLAFPLTACMSCKALYGS